MHIIGYFAASNTNDPSPAIAQLQQQSPIDGAQPDQTVVRRVLERLLPVFCEIFQKTLVSNVRRSSLNLMRKAIHYISSETLQSMVSNQTNVGTDDQRIAEKIVAVLGSVLDQEDDIDGHSQVLSVSASEFF
jgi:E3 ubiquitin-protein ligase HECTD1